MNHGEGELRGSIVDRDKKPPFNTQDLLLISCSNSTIKRGDGEGANALSFGSAGTTITHIKNPTLHQIFTSITLPCGTFVVPGGRMDWISALSCFFTLPQGPELADSDNSRNRSDADDAVYISSFFLELVDIALSFEPHKFDEAVQPVEESCEKYVACLLAAASLNVSHHAMANSSTNEYKFQLQDVGLLICESSGSKSNRISISMTEARMPLGRWSLILSFKTIHESCAKAFKLDLEVVKPDPLTPLEEYRLHLELLPIRLHLDQSQLNFLIHFFGKDADRISSQPNEPNDVEKSEISGKKKVNYGKKAIVEEALLPFFQAKKHYGNCSYNYFLQGIDLQLKHVCAVGVYGWNSICETVAGQWLEDISHNQVHKLLKGLPPIRSLYAVSSGASKLVSLPIKSYKKDHKLLKGMQRGARAFIRSISLEAVGLGVHLAAGAHEVLLQTEYILTSIPPSMPSSERDKREMTVRSNQPKDAQQGIRRACESISDGLGRTASALVGTPFKTHSSAGEVWAGPALVTAILAAPAAAMAPVSASARSCALCSSWTWIQSIKRNPWRSILATNSRIVEKGERRKGVPAYGGKLCLQHVRKAAIQKQNS
ncbi:hypothetical protein J5N97_011848 [Dioscorea zingiberensis]|uniref:Autophagy-related protein 2 n=1 Tax=Dioscorea zingiberensis TaxID=325984 RepID=A0A9D5D1W3_9LILI|nr:hypothetical protein J5N97_011848 [Dioscorea zingiberensis]